MLGCQDLDPEFTARLARNTKHTPISRTLLYPHIMLSYCPSLLGTEHFGANHFLKVVAASATQDLPQRSRQPLRYL